MPCFPAQLQSSAKSFLRPGTWLPGARTFHTYTESWKINGDPEQCLEEMMNAVERLNETEHPSEYFVNKVRHQDYWMQIFAYTPAGWLDVVEISFLPHGEETSLAKISSFSTGMLPAWFPFGFICDVLIIYFEQYKSNFQMQQILCWCPFSDQGMNEYRCQLLRETLPFHVSVLHETEDEQLIPSHLKTSAKKYESTPANLSDESQKNK